MNLFFVGDAPIRQPAEFKEVFTGTCKSNWWLSTTRRYLRLELSNLVSCSWVVSFSACALLSALCREYIHKYLDDNYVVQAQSSGDPNADCVEATVLVDVPGLKYKMQVGELGYQDVQNLLALIKTTNEISCSMVRLGC
jgi:hypothetical protein